MKHSKVAGRNPEISVVVPSYNSSKTILSCIDSLMHQNTRLDYEVILVDSSRDGTAALVKKKYPSVAVLKSNKRLYPGPARNRGIKRARGRIVACIDSDCVARPDWLENIYNVHQTYDVVGGTIRNGNPESIIGWGLFFTEFSAFMGNESKVVANMPTCNISYKSEIFGEYGYYPEYLEASEDFAFHSRINRKKFFSRNVVISHINKTKLSHILRHSKWLGKGSALARRKAELPGRFLLRYKWLVPFVLFYRFLKIGSRALSRNFIYFVLSSPFVFATLVAWYAGFRQGVIEDKRKILKSRQKS